MTLDINLDIESEVEDFIAKHGTTKGRTLANSLGLSGKGSAKAASALSRYAWNKHTAITLRRDGRIAEAMKYEAICDTIYARDIQPHIDCWWPALLAETAISKAQGYIRRIRNKRKQEYAAAYFGHLQGLLDHEPNSHDYDIRPMTAQGVRWELEKILGT